MIYENFGFKILEGVSSLFEVLGSVEAGESCGLKMLSYKSGLSPSEAQRILSDLVAAKLVTRLEDGTFQIGKRIQTLGALVKE